jgi:SAM-dependent methyltransferase
MGTNYDLIVKEYQNSKTLPWRQYLEIHSFFKLAGDLSGKLVLDLACGDGFYARLLKLRGAEYVEGVDLSQGMIDKAKELEAENPLGIHYQKQDVLNLELNQKYDLITAAYLLNYAQNSEELIQFCQVISKHLKPGGRFITINSNPDGQSPFEALRPYGFTRHDLGKNEGDEVIYRFYQPDESYIDVINYHLEKSTHEHAFEKAGLIHTQWHETSVSDEGKKKFNSTYWQAIVDYQPVIGISCEKPNP